MKGTLTIGLVALVTGVTGCSSITQSEMQSIMLSSKTKSGEPVEGAQCTMQSPRGEWKATTPASVIVRRDSEDLQVDCRKEGHSPGLVKAISRAHGGMFGNIIFGGGIGAIIDHSNGKGYDYPDNIVAIMGESIVLDRNKQIEEERNRPAQSVREPEKK